MVTSDVVFSRDDTVPSGTSKNGTVIVHAGLQCGLFDTKNPIINTGISDDLLETKYSNRFDDYDYYLPRS